MKEASFRWLIGFGMLCCASPARAEEATPHVALRWSAPEECPDDLQLVHEIEHFLGRNLRDAGAQSLSIQVTVERNSAPGYAGKIAFRSPLGLEQRSIEHSDCEKLTQGIALMIALVVDPERVNEGERVANEAAAQGSAEPSPRTLEPTPARASEPAPRASAPCANAPVSTPQPSPLHGTRLAFDGFAATAPLPSFGLGFEAALGYRRHSFRAELFARSWLSRDQRVDAAESATLELRLNTLGLRGCWLPLAGAWQAAACIGGQWGELRGSGSGSGLERPRTRGAAYADAALRLELAYAQAQLAPFLGVDLSAALARPAFGVLSNGAPLTTFRPAAWAFSAFFGVALEL